MRNGRTFAALLLALFVSSTVAVAGAAGPGITRPDPVVVSTVAVGQTFVVNIYLQDVTDAYGADVRMCFDPTILEAQDADSFAPGIQIQPLNSFMNPGFVIKREASNAPDAARAECQSAGFVWYAFTQLNPAQPVTGSGPLAAVTFKALKAGVSPLTIAYQKLANRDGGEVPTGKQDGSVKVGGASAKQRVLLPVALR